MANAVMQACPHWVVVGVEVVWHCIPYIAGGVDEAVRWARGNGHGNPKVADKEVKGVPLAGVISSLKSITCCLEVDLYVLDEVQNLVWSIQARLNPADNESHIGICDHLMLAVCLEDQEDGSSPTELRRAIQSGGMNMPPAMGFHRQSREMCCMQSVHLMGQKQMSPKLSPS